MAKMASEPTEEKKIEPIRCVCGSEAVMVIHKGKKMYSCPNTMTCAMRSGFCKTKYDAIKVWNTEIEAEKYRRRAKNG